MKYIANESVSKKRKRQRGMRRGKEVRGGQNEGEINVFWQSIWKSPVNKTLSTSECCRV